MKKVFSTYMSVFLLGVILTACGGGGGGDSQPTPSPKTSWTIQHGTASEDLANGIALDSSGNIYVAGFTSGSLDGKTYAGGRDIFVVKYSADRTRQWTKQLGTASDDEAIGIAVDNSGNVYVTGYTSGDLAGSGSHKGVEDFFVVKFDTNGVWKWTQQLGTTAYDLAFGIVVDGSDIYVTGATTGYLGDTGSKVGTDADLFMVKFTQTADGNSAAMKWKTQLGTTEHDYANGIALDSSGNIYVSGVTKGYLGDTGSKVGTDEDLFVAKFTQAADGNSAAVTWKTQLGTVENDWANGIALDGSGSNIYVTGYTYGGLDGNSNANPITDPLQFTADIFVVKYAAANGTKQWTRQLGTVENDRGLGIALYSSGIYATGGTCGDLDENTNAGAGCSDFFVVKYAADGTKQ